MRANRAKPWREQTLEERLHAGLDEWGSPVDSQHKLMVGSEMADAIEEGMLRWLREGVSDGPYGQSTWSVRPCNGAVAAQTPAATATEPQMEPMPSESERPQCPQAAAAEERPQAAERRPQARPQAAEEAAEEASQASSPFPAPLRTPPQKFAFTWRWDGVTPTVVHRRPEPPAPFRLREAAVATPARSVRSRVHRDLPSASSIAVVVVSSDDDM